MTSFRRLAWGIPPRPMQAWEPFWIFQAQYYASYFPSYQEVTELDIWVIFLTQFVPHWPFFYFLNMQQSWAGPSKLHRKNNATPAQLPYKNIEVKDVKVTQDIYNL